MDLFGILESLAEVGIAVTGFAGEILAAAGVLVFAASMYIVAVLWFFFIAVTRFAALVADHLETAP